MWYLQAAQAGGKLLGAFQSYSAQKRLYKAQKAWQEYNNKMLRLADAQNQNAITTNTLIAQEASTFQAFNNQRTAIATKGTATVAAGAAGVKGNSVDMTFVDIARNAGYAEYLRELNLDNQFTVFEDQRKGSALQAHMQQDFSYIPKPSLATELLGGLAGAVQQFTRDTGGNSAMSASQILGF